MANILIVEVLISSLEIERRLRTGLWEERHWRDSTRCHSHLGCPASLHQDQSLRLSDKDCGRMRICFGYLITNRHSADGVRPR